MPPKKIKYAWKIPRPKDDHVARKLMKAAYETAMGTDPKTTTVLIRQAEVTSKALQYSNTNHAVVQIAHPYHNLEWGCVRR